MNVNSKTFIIHMAIWEQEKIAIDPDKKTQIEAQI